MDIRGKTVFITGATQGIGRAAALRFAAAGCAILPIARSAQDLADVARAIESAGGTCLDPLAADVSDAAVFVPLLRQRAEQHGPDIVVINAGVGQYGPFASTPPEDWLPILRTNVDGALATAQAVLPSMLQRTAGSIVFISSTIGKRSVPYNAAYCASKFAVQGFSEALRLELRPANIHVGVVCPARTDTAFFERMRYSVPQRSRRSIPTSDPSKVAEAIVRCVRRRRREIVVTAEGKLFSYVGLHFPRIADYVIYKAVPRPESTP